MFRSSVEYMDAVTRLYGTALVAAAADDMLLSPELAP
jgi:hypothetical protein